MKPRIDTILEMRKRGFSLGLIGKWLGVMHRREISGERVRQIIARHFGSQEKLDEFNEKYGLTKKEMNKKRIKAKWKDWKIKKCEGCDKIFLANTYKKNNKYCGVGCYWRSYWGYKYGKEKEERALRGYEMLKDGATYEEVGEELGISHMTINRDYNLATEELGRRGLNLVEKYNKRRKEEKRKKKKEVLKYAEMGLEPHEIEELTGLNYHTIWAYLSEED